MLLAFIGHQLYRITAVHFSAGLTALVFDIALAWLTWSEYRSRRAGTSQPALPAGLTTARRSRRQPRPGTYRQADWTLGDDALSVHTAFSRPTFAAAIGPVRACPWMWSRFCPCAPASAHFCPCDARPPGLSVRAIGAGGPELQPTSPLLSVDPRPCPVRYLSVTSVATWPSMTADGTG